MNRRPLHAACLLRLPAAAGRSRPGNFSHAQPDPRRPGPCCRWRAQP